MNEIQPDKIYTGRSTIRMYNRDCMDLLNSGKTWDLAIVDPPYGINCTVEIGLGDKKSGRIGRDSKWGTKKWDIERPSQEYFIYLKKYSNNQIIFGGNYFADMISPSRCWIVWDKVQRINQADAELAWTSFSSSVRVYQYHCSNLQGFRNPNRFHPTEKPIQLYKWLLNNYAEQGQTILDTHGGSMSIAIACWDMGFDLDICELDTDYFKEAVKRFENHIKQQTLF